MILIDTNYLNVDNAKRKIIKCTKILLLVLITKVHFQNVLST